MSQHYHHKDIFDPTNFEELRRPLLEASGLPGYCYVSDEWYAAEVANIFLKNWICVGRTDQIPEVGNYIYQDIAGEPVVVVRNEDNDISALSPICRHRGSKVVSESGTCKRFVCPYHQWTYSLKGDLLRTPRCEGMEDFAKEGYGLRTVRAEMWDGFVFVNFDLTAIPLLEYLGDLPDRMRRYQLEKLKVARVVSHTVPCNWKLYADNTSEVLHLPAVHGGTIEQVGAASVWKWDQSEVKGNWFNFYGDFPGSLSLLAGEPGFPAIEGFDKERAERHEIPIIYPNAHFFASPDCFWWETYWPEGPNQTRVLVYSCFHEDRFERADFEEIAQQYYNRLDTTYPEDIGVSRAVHGGVSAPTYRPGRFSEWEDIVHAFSNKVVDQVIGSVGRQHESGVQNRESAKNA